MRVYLLLAALVLTGCSDDVPTETFDLTQCRIAPTLDVRTVRVQTGCAMYTHVGNSSFCTMWNHATVVQHRQVLTCSRDEWTGATAAARTIWPARPIWRRVYNV